MEEPEDGDTSEIRQRIADLLDRVLVRAENGYTVQQALSELAATQTSEALGQILARAQGVVGMVNSSSPGSPLFEKALQDVVALKQELRS